MYTLLVDEVEDIKELRNSLEAQGHVVDIASSERRVMKLAKLNHYDAVVLAKDLPDSSGIELCRKLRAGIHQQTPVILISSEESIDDRLESFNAGVDDFLVRPFDVRELDIRLNSVVRRAAKTADARTLTCGELSCDLITHHIERNGKGITLTPTGFQILVVLLKRCNRVVSSDELINSVWGSTASEDQVESLRVHMSTLRSRIDKPFKTPLIKTIWGVGYRISDPKQAHLQVG